MSSKSTDKVPSGDHVPNQEDEESIYGDAPEYIMAEGEDSGGSTTYSGAMALETEAAVGLSSKPNSAPPGPAEPEPPVPVLKLKPLPKQSASVPVKQAKTSEPDQPSASRDTFVTFYVDKGEHRSRFLILPSQRKGPAGRRDQLAEFILEGGGLVLQDAEEESLSEVDKKHLIKILDLDFLKGNINKLSIQNMQVPYDCFSSHFIWSQYYQRNFDKNRLVEMDLNLFRISPSAYLDYNANRVLNGSLSWDDIPPVTTEKLSPTISVKQIALQFFPQVLCSNSWKANPGVPKRTRRIYTREESQHLLDMVCEHDGYSKIHSIVLYNQLSANCFPDRSSISLREHFRQTILPHVMAGDDYYSLSEDDVKRFEAAQVEYEGRPYHGKRKRVG